MPTFYLCLPVELLISIFGFFHFAKRLRIEGVCRLLKNECKIWVDTTDIKFTNVLFNWKNQQIDTESETGQLRLLSAFKSIITRCAPTLRSLRIDYCVKSSLSVCQHFHFLKRLTHFSMVEPINVWHLNQIEVHLAPNLLSLGLVLESQKTTLDAFLSLVLKCGKLECLRINLFDQIFERSLENGQKQFLPSSLQQLFIEDYSYSGLNAIRQTCSGLCFVLCNNSNFAKMLGFYSPFYITPKSESLNFHPCLDSLRALKIQDFDPNKTDFLKITSNCTNLEHSDFEWSSDLNPNDLLQLYNLKKLSSLSIQILLTDEYGSIPFHEYTFGGRKFDDFF